jgi:hypothetical protein
LPAVTALSWGWHGLQSILSTELAKVLVPRSLYGLRQWLTFEVFALLNLPEDLILPEDPLLAFCSPPESCCTDAVTLGLPSWMTASLAVPSPSTSSRYRAATHPGGYQPPGTCPLGVSHALRAFLRPGPASLVSCWSRPWGSPFRVDLHPQSRSSSRMPCPHEVGRPCELPSRPSRTLQLLGMPGSTSTAFRGDGPPYELPLLRALLPASVRVHEANCLS